MVAGLTRCCLSLEWVQQAYTSSIHKVHIAESPCLIELSHIPLGCSSRGSQAALDSEHNLRIRALPFESRQIDCDPGTRIIDGFNNGGCPVGIIKKMRSAKIVGQLLETRESIARGYGIRLRAAIAEGLAMPNGYEANAYAQDAGLDRAETLQRIRVGFDAEWSSPTDKPSGQVKWVMADRRWSPDSLSSMVRCTICREPGRDQWFDELERRGIDPHSADVPPEFCTDVWRRRR